MNENITLSELNLSVKDTLQENFAQTYRVVAEISEMRESRGHAYLELIEKDNSGKTTAKARATIWAYTYRIIRPYFETTTGHSLEAGLKVLVVVTVEFHEIYGYSLNIRDIDPTYTLGDIERRRLEIIRQLNEEGIFDMNKELDIPVVPQKIAIISSETAAGYGDFINQLENNESDYKFYYKLFPATVQGNEAEDSIISAFDKIYEYDDFFDVVVLIRGGGSKADLSCFDSYFIAQNIAQFTLPVITGIGHERDESIADLVANTSLKTPTAVAEFLISNLQNFESEINFLKDSFVSSVNEMLYEKKTELNNTVHHFKPLVKDILHIKENELVLVSQKVISESKNYISSKRNTLNNIPEKLNYLCKNLINKESQNINLLKLSFKNTTEGFITQKKHEINISEQKNNYLNPQNVLERGFSYTVINNKIIKTSSKLKKGDTIESHFYKGKVKSKII